MYYLTNRKPFSVFTLPDINTRGVGRVRESYATTGKKFTIAFPKSCNPLKGLVLRLVDLWLKQNCLGLPVSMLVKESRKWVENLWTLHRALSENSEETHWRKDTLINRQRNERFWYFSLIPQDNKPGWYQFHSGPVSHYVDLWWQKRTFIWNITALDRLSLTIRQVELKSMNPIFRRNTLY